MHTCNFFSQTGLEQPLGELKLAEDEPEALPEARHSACRYRAHVDAQAIAAVVEAAAGIPGYCNRVQAFVCGPQPFMDAMARVLHDAGVLPEHVTMESFEY